MDFSIFATPEAWINLAILIFLEIVLGVDNLVFIAITTNRLPVEQQKLGRRLGLLGALMMRILFLSFASFIVHMKDPVFTITLGSFIHGVSIRDLVLLLGGVYLIYKGIIELREIMKLTEAKAERCEEHKKLHQIALPQAVLTIMVMDLVFSIDSVITAVGLVDYLIIMIIAVMTAVFVMILFINQISNFINRHTEMKILALVFIVTIGILLILDGMGIHIGIELMGMPIEKLMIYFAMVFSIVITLIQMAYKKSLDTWHAELAKQDLSGRDIAEQGLSGHDVAEQGLLSGQDADSDGQGLPGGQNANSSGQDVSSNGQDISSDGQDISSDGQDISSDGQDAASLGFQGASPVTLEVDPETQGASSDRQE